MTVLLTRLGVGLETSRDSILKVLDGFWTARLSLDSGWASELQGHAQQTVLLIRSSSVEEMQIYTFSSYEKHSAERSAAVTPQTMSITDYLGFIATPRPTGLREGVAEIAGLDSELLLHTLFKHSVITLSR